jgi:hypothetical protein
MDEEVDRERNEGTPRRTCAAEPHFFEVKPDGNDPSLRRSCFRVAIASAGAFTHSAAIAIRVPATPWYRPTARDRPLPTTAQGGFPLKALND